MRFGYNNSVGQLGGTGLTNIATTATFSSAPSWATIASGQPNGGDYIPLILDPASNTPDTSFEIAYVTGYTAGQTTATLQRGCEGTTAVAHSAGNFWEVGPTAYDMMFGHGVDAPWAGNTSYDYEFLNSGTSLPSGWSWYHQDTLTYSEVPKAGILTSSGPSASTQSFSGIMGSCPAAPFTVTAKLAMSAANAAVPGALFISDGTKVITIMSNPVTSSNLYAETWTNSTTLGTGIASFALTSAPFRHCYLRIIYTSASNISFQYSADGLAWSSLASNWNSSSFLTPSNIGYGIYNPHGAAAACQLSCEWIRVR